MAGKSEHPSLSEARLGQIIAAYLEADQAGQQPDRLALLTQNPELADELKGFFENHDRMAQLAEKPKAAIQAALAQADTVPCEPASLSNLAAGDGSGTRVRYFGDYELLEIIARGGMGVVFKARQISLNRIVAVKMILAGQLADDSDIQRFYAEAQAAAQLQHPNIVAIHEVGFHEGHHYFSMDFVEGRSLADLVRESPVPGKRVAKYVKTIAEAIHYAHQKGILHRDLKPSNVLIDSSDQPRITDFGLAKRIEGGSKLTASGQIVGTPSYMPPEQASEKYGKLGPASDVYALGAVLYELLTGRPPFLADTPVNTLIQVLDRDHEPERPRTLNRLIDRDLETICVKCLQKDSRKRYQTAQELAEDLERYLIGEHILARRLGPVGHAVRWARYNPALAATLVALAVFYANHLVALHVLKVEDVGGDYHQFVSRLIPLWAIGAAIFQCLFRKPSWKGVASFAWTGMNVVLLTFLLLAGHGPRSSLLPCYLLLIAVAASRLQVSLVWFVTALCMVSYLCLAMDAVFHRPHLIQPTHFSSQFVLSLAILGVILHLILRRIRTAQVED